MHGQTITYIKSLTLKLEVQKAKFKFKSENENKKGMSDSRSELRGNS